VATVSGTQRDPRAQADVALTGARFRAMPVSAAAAGRYANGRVALDAADVAYGGGVADASGTVDGIAGARPTVNVAAHVRGADVGTIARELGVKLPYPDAGLDADVRVRGAATSPAIAGDARIAAGSINGLAFRDVDVPISGGLGGLDVRGGRATVGSTTVRFDAFASRAGARGTLRSERVDLADFNDYFDAGDTLAGRGRVAVGFAAGPGMLATSGDVALAGTRYRRLPIGDVAARWSSRGRTIAANAQVGGTHGRLVANGTATVPARDPVARIRDSAVDAHAVLAGLDLTTWLPAVGIVAPVTGFVDGDVRVRGVAPALAVAGSASLRDGAAGRVPIRRLDVAAAGTPRAVRVTRAHVEALNLVADASGAFGLGAHDPVALALHATAPDIVAFANRATGSTYDAAGALDTTLTVSGTRAAPIVRDVADVDAPRYRTTAARHAHLDVAYGNGRMTVADSVLDLIAGRIALSGTVPASPLPPFVDRRDAPMSARIVAQGVDVGQFAALLPKGTKAGGIVDGDVAVSGTLGAPSFAGGVQLAKGTFVSPDVASEIRNVAVRAGLAGRDVRLTALHADVGGGAVDGTGSARIGDLRRGIAAIAFNVDTQEKNLGIDLPRLFRGKVDGALSLRHDVDAPVLIGGDLRIAHARIPLSALLPSKSSSAAPPALPPVAFALNVDATTDDRLQGPAVDVGAKGAVHVGGTLAQPALSGGFSSTDGTISFYRTFVLQKARVAFDPANGIVPYVNATATTHVPDPATDVLLNVRGEATNLSISFASRPDYDREQIVGLLIGAQNFGAIPGIARTSPSAASSGNLVQGAAIGYVDSQFTQQLFEPFSSSLGRALGLENVNLNAGLTGGFAASATRRLGDRLQATFSEENDGGGQRQSVALAANLPNATALQLTLFGAGTQGRTIGTQTPFAPIGPVNYQLQALAPPPGSSGYVFTYVHRFW
jgi:autotransporter translocation and assembly factor TamB